MASKLNTFFSGTVGPRGDRPGPDSVLTRAGLYLLGAVLFPVAIAVYATWLALFTYARLPWWVPTAAGGTLTLAALVTGTLGPDGAAMYVGALTEIWTSVGSGGDFFATFGENLPTLLLGQVWLSLVGATAWAGVVTGWKYARRPRHEEKFLAPGPILWKRWRKTAEQIAKGTDSPKSGLTLGIAQDTRHPWYAGGAAGERFGSRVVLTDKELAAHALVIGASGGGKALDVDTPIPTPKGFVRMGDLAVGDEVFGSDGKPVRVVRAHDVLLERECYEVVFSDGSSVVADADHLWTVHTTTTRANVNRAARRSVARRRVGSDHEIRSVRAALDAAEPGQLVSSTETAALLDRTNAYDMTNRILKALPAAGTTRIGPFPQQYGSRTVLKTRTVAGWDARAAYAAVLERLEAVWHDQRSIANTEPETLTTADMVARMRGARSETFSIPLAGVVQYPTRAGLPLDPYVLGLWLGDGATNESRFTTADDELLAAFREAGFAFRQLPTSPYDFYVYGIARKLREAGILGDKHIPDAYLISDESQRRALLAGLLDSDGTFEHHARVSFANKSERLADQVVELAASLGYRPTKTSRMVTLPDGRAAGPYYNVAFSAPDDVFRLERKNALHRAGRASYSEPKRRHRYITEIRPVESRPVRCIGVDADDHLFLAGRTFIATHNTQGMLIGIRDAIRQGRPVVFIDCKGDNEVAERIQEWSQRYGREFLHWSIFDQQKTPYEGPADKPAFYDPISRGDPSRRKELLMGAFLWESPYYKNIIENFLQILFRVQDLVPPLPGQDYLSDTAMLLEPEALVRRARYIDRLEQAELTDSLARAAQMGPQERSGIASMWSRINTLTASTAGQWLRADPDKARDIDFTRVAHEGQVVVFTLPGNMYPELSSLVAGLIIQDLKTAGQELLNDPAPLPFHVYVDEFGVIESSNVLGLLQRARASKMPCMVATQSLADLARHDPTFPNQVIDTVSLFLIHRVNSEHDARTFAGLSGIAKKTVERVAIEKSSGIFGTVGATTATGGGYVEERDDYVIPVGAFQKLRELEGILIAKGSDRYLNTYYVIPEDADIVKVKGGYAAKRGLTPVADHERDRAVDVHRPGRRPAYAAELKTYPHPSVVDVAGLSDGHATNVLDLIADRPAAPAAPQSDASAPTGGAVRPTLVPASPSHGAPAGAPLPGVAAEAPVAGKPAGAPVLPQLPVEAVGPTRPDLTVMAPPPPPARTQNPEEWGSIP